MILDLFIQKVYARCAAQRLGTMTNNIEARAGKYSFSQLDSLRKLLVDDLATPMSRLGREQTGKPIKKYR